MKHAAFPHTDGYRVGSASSAVPDSLSVVIPAHNEAGNIATLLQEVCDALRGRIEFEIVCVDDGSSDGTGQVLWTLKSGIPELRPFQHDVCRGQSVALLTGVQNAYSPWIATLDGDGQNDPADIPSLIARLEESPPDVKLIAGWRVRLKAKVQGAQSRHSASSGCVVGWSAAKAAVGVQAVSTRS